MECHCKYMISKQLGERNWKWMCSSFLAFSAMESRQKTEGAIQAILEIYYDNAAKSTKNRLTHKSGAVYKCLSSSSAWGWRCSGELPLSTGGQILRGKASQTTLLQSRNLSSSPIASAFNNPKDHVQLIFVKIYSWALILYSAVS